MMNPFVYGEAVQGKNFCNRQKEIQELAKDIYNSQNVMIYSPRRYGKTSLIKKVLQSLDRKRFYIVYIDLYPMLTEEDFILISTRTITRELNGSLKSMVKRVRELFGKLSPKMSVDFSEDGTPGFHFSLDRKDVIPAVQDVFDGLYKDLKRKKMKGVVVFDEFQQIAELKTDKLEKELRSRIQTHRDIAYIFMGSKKHLIYDMFSNPNRPFYKSTRHFPLSKIGDADLNKFIKKKFTSHKKQISDEIVHAIINITESHPYYIQFLCHVLWGLSREGKKVLKSDLEDAVELAIKREEIAFSNIWDLLTAKQKRVLVALVNSETSDKIYSSDFLKRYRIGSPGTLQKVLIALMDKNLIDKTIDQYLVTDVFFKLWILREIPLT